MDYTRTKALAERRLRAALPFVETLTLRPSFVILDEVLTEEMVREAIYPLCIMKNSPAVPIIGDPSTDLVPLSFVTRTSFALMMSPARRYDLYHLSAGPTLSPSWRSILSIVADHFGAPAPERLGGAEWPKTEQRLPPDTRRALRLLRPYFRFINQNTLYANDRVLAETGPVNQSDFDPASYLPPLLSLISDQAAQNEAARLEVSV